MGCRQVKRSKEVMKPNNVVIVEECCCHHVSGGLLGMTAFGKEEGLLLTKQLHPTSQITDMKSFICCDTLNVI